MATCIDPACGLEMTDSVGCRGATEYVIRGTPYPRIWNAEQFPACHDCAAPFGTLHHPGCDSEICPRCQGQVISCGCDDELPEPDPDDAEAQRIGDVFADARAEQDRGL